MEKDMRTVLDIFGIINNMNTIPTDEKKVLRASYFF
jgi:glycine/serine hydroxymethyltransferase